MLSPGKASCSRWLGPLLSVQLIIDIHVCTPSGAVGDDAAGGDEVGPHGCYRGSERHPTEFGHVSATEQNPCRHSMPDQPMSARTGLTRGRQHVNL